MKTAEQIYKEHQPERYGNGAYIIPEDWQLQAMEAYASQQPVSEVSREWISVKDRLPDTDITNFAGSIENKDLLVLYYIPYDSLEFGVWNGQEWEIPDVGFAPKESVSKWCKLPTI